ncbi:histidine phosphatase family protein [Fontibacillus sp. BL9]|uniref:histidine phosphatase family protein n=1 Tax=Fontibacillus sp. BL9 TaxID=3389971 RepID=UPI00397D3298
MKLFLIRHGQSIGNLFLDEDLPDSPLTSTGLLQADKVASFLGRKSVTRIVSSPLIRAMQTAMPLSDLLSIPVEIWMNLYEYREGPAFYSLPRKEIQKFVPDVVLPDEILEPGWRCPGGENRETVENRAKSIVRQVRRCTDDSIALFAHGMLIDFLIREILQLSSGSNIEFVQANTCINCFELNENGVKVLSMNQTEHLCCH